MANEYRTARRFSRPSPLFRWWEATGGFEERGQALVFGAGLLVEAERLVDLGWKVDVVETSDSIARRQITYSAFAARPKTRVLEDLAASNRHYRIVVVTHVIEFIERRMERERILRDLTRRLTKSGRLLLSLRGWSDVSAAKRKTRRGDGFVTGQGTWVRGFTVPEAEALIKSAGLEIETALQGMRSRIPEQVRMICRKR